MLHSYLCPEKFALEMFARRVCLLAKRTVPINCRTPTAESTAVTRREKIEWAVFIAVLTVVPVGFQLWQFHATSATNVNRQVMDELSRNREQVSPASHHRKSELTL